MELLKFELYKIFKQKIIYITFILLVAFSTGFTFNSASDLEKNLYKEWEGTLTKEKVQLAERENAILMEKKEELEFGQITSNIDNTKLGIYETIAYIKSIEGRLKERILKLEKENNYNSQLEQTMIKKVDLSYFSFNKGPKQIIDYASVYSIFITGAMLLIGLSTIYTQEYSSGVDNYILSSKNGRKQLMLSKVMASLIYTIVVVLTGEFFNIIWNVIQYGNEGWNTAIQYYFKYFFSPFGFNLLEFHLIQLGLHLFASFSFALLIVLVSSLCKKSLISLIFSGAIFSLPYFVVEMLKMPKWLEDVFHFSFIYIMNVEFFFDNFRTINLFGYPVLYPIVAIVLMVVLAVIFVMITSGVMRSKEVTS